MQELERNSKDQSTSGKDLEKLPLKYTGEDFFRDLDEALKEAGLPFQTTPIQESDEEATQEYEIRFIKRPRQEK